jgi:hypothetical protein
MKSRAVLFLWAACLAWSGLACDGAGSGGGGNGPGPAVPDFSLSLAPDRVMARVGTVSAPFSVSVTGHNGFAGIVTITLSGFPAGAASHPASPFTLEPGESRDVTIAVPAFAAVADYDIQVTGTSGALSHGGRVKLGLMSVETFEDGAMLFLTAQTPEETARIGLLKAWSRSV